MPTIVALDSLVLGGWTEASAINSWREHTHGWDRSGRITDLGPLDGNTSEAVGVNDRGTIIGFDDGPRCAVLWRR